jgi:hypothetical protein
MERRDVGYWLKLSYSTQRKNLHTTSRGSDLQDLQTSTTFRPPYVHTSNTFIPARLPDLHNLHTSIPACLPDVQASAALCLHDLQTHTPSRPPDLYDSSTSTIKREGRRRRGRAMTGSWWMASKSWMACRR